MSVFIHVVHVSCLKNWVSRGVLRMIALTEQCSNWSLMTTTAWISSKASTTKQLLMLTSAPLRSLSDLLGGKVVDPQRKRNVHTRRATIFFFLRHDEHAELQLEKKILELSICEQHQQQLQQQPRQQQSPAGRIWKIVLGAQDHATEGDSDQNQLCCVENKSFPSSSTKRSQQLQALSVRGLCSSSPTSQCQSPVRVRQRVSSSQSVISNGNGVSRECE